MTDTIPVPGASIGVVTPEVPIASVQGPQIIQQEPAQNGISELLRKLNLLKKENTPTPAEIGVAAATTAPATSMKSPTTPAVANLSFVTEVAVPPPVVSSTPEASVSGSNEVSMQNVAVAAPAENPNLGSTVTESVVPPIEQSTPVAVSEPAFQAADTTTVSQGLGTVPEGSAPATQITPDMIKPGADGGIPSVTNVLEATQGVEAPAAEKTPLTPEQNTAAEKILSVLTDPATLDILNLLKTQVTS